jgi:hypothetical protein
MLLEAVQSSAAISRLPFRVKIASAEELMGVARLRAAAYGKHLPALATNLLQPEAADFEPGNVVFVAVSKFDGSMLGTLRTHANVFKPLPLEASIALPEHFHGRRMIEATRLSVLGSLQSSVVRNALFKAYYQYSLQQKADWMLATGRRPIDRMYDGLMFTDVLEPGTFYPMAHVAGVPHRVMCLAPADAEPRWRQAEHPLYSFAFQDRHPDIDISGARSLDALLEPIDMSQGVAEAISNALDEPHPALRVPDQCTVLGVHKSADSANGVRPALG